MSLHIEYVDAPVGAQEAAEPFAYNTQSFGKASQIAAGANDTPWVSLETNGWSLNGKGLLIPENAQDIGWWSGERSGEDGRFANPPEIDIYFPGKSYTATGITFRFWPSLEDWCSEMIVQWYKDGNHVDSVQVYPDSANWILQHSVDDFDQINIQIMATNKPGQYAKIQQIQVGQVVFFMHNEIVSVSLLTEIDPSLCELSADAMTIEIRDIGKRKIIPQKSQTMHLYQNGVQIAAHYVDDFSRESAGVYRFECTSAIGQLEDDYLGGVYSEKPLTSVLSGLLSGFEYSIDESFANAKITGYLPACTRREALQQISFAIGAVVKTGETGTIRLLPPEEVVTGAIENDRIFTGAKVKQNAPIVSVQVVSHSYTPNEETETLLENEHIGEVDVLYVFSEPHHSYELTGQEATLDSYGENWVRISAPETVTLTAKKYTHSSVVHTKKNQVSTNAQKGQVITVDSATLINSQNVTDAMDRLHEYYMNDQLLTEDIVVNGEHAGDKVSSSSPWGNKIVGYITKMESTFTGNGHRSSIQVSGTEVAE